MTAVILSVRSTILKCSNAVWVDSTAVGRIAHSHPKDDIMGKATEAEHFPTQEISCIVTILFITFLKN